MNARMMICASAVALAGALVAAEPAQAALTLIAVGGGGGGEGGLGAGAGGVLSESGASGGVGAGGTGGLGGGGADAGGGAGWLGGGGGGTGGGGGLSAPTFAGGVGFGLFDGAGGFGGGGGYSGGGGSGLGAVGGGGGGGSYLNPAMRDTMEIPDFNGTAGGSPSNGYVIVGFTVLTAGAAAVGAQGGSVFSNGGGYGAGVGGEVFLDAGTELDIVAGGAGMADTLSFINGGGGGSFVWDPAPIPAQPVPEPSTWAMMLIGFAGLGFTGCRTSKRLAGGPRSLV